MSQSSDYKNLKDLTKSLSNGIQKLESGNLDSNELTSLLEDSRTLHERITVLQYLAFEKEVKVSEVKKLKKEPKKEPKKESKKQQGNFELNFGTPEVEEERGTKIVEELSVENEDELNEEIHPNQINLLDAIDEVIPEDEYVDTDVEKGSVSIDETNEQDSSTSINDKFASEGPGKTLADKLSRQPIKDLKAAIGLNQKFLFMNDLFEGENEIFNNAIDKINAFDNLTQAMEYVDNNLSSTYSWDKDNSSVLNFIDLVERRFMA